LLSQLVTRDARGQPPVDEGASGGGEKAATGRTRHEGCLQDWTNCPNAQADATCAGWVASRPGGKPSA